MWSTLGALQIQCYVPYNPAKLKMYANLANRMTEDRKPDTGFTQCQQLNKFLARNQNKKKLDDKENVETKDVGSRGRCNELKERTQRAFGRLQVELFILNHANGGLQRANESMPASVS
ncbi:hypothetical protein CBL_08555 [Carabus blaptoides fortunei]